MYFVALAGTGLRYDPRVCLAAGAAALLQYGAIVTWVGLFEPSVRTVEPIYGSFQWDSQVSRLQLIAVATIIHAAVVVRSRTFWLDSMRDHLTGLFNRGFFDESLARLVSSQADAARPFTLALIDLDNFKSVNDRYGHQAGDDALRYAAERLREAFRDEDIIARYGGEEFAVLVQADRVGAVARLDAWRIALNADSRIPRLSASVGVASLPEDGGSGRSCSRSPIAGSTPPRPRAATVPWPTATPPEDPMTPLRRLAPLAAGTALLAALAAGERVATQAARRSARTRLRGRPAVAVPAAAVDAGAGHRRGRRRQRSRVGAASTVVAHRRREGAEPRGGVLHRRAAGARVRRERPLPARLGRPGRRLRVARGRARHPRRPQAQRVDHLRRRPAALPAARRT